MPKFYTKKHIELAFEYGLIFSDVANNMKVDLTPELSERMEKILISEFKKNSFKRVALDMLPNILACFETK
jgi:hypothetical protein